MSRVHTENEFCDFFVVFCASNELTVNIVGALQVYLNLKTNEAKCKIT